MLHKIVVAVIMLPVLVYFVKNIIRLIKKVSCMTRQIWLVLFICGVMFVWIKSPSESLNDTPDSTPVILWWTDGFPASSGTRLCLNNIKCDMNSGKNNSTHIDVDAYLFYGSSIEFDDLPLPRRPSEIIWGLYHEESPKNVEELMHESVLKIFNYSSTFSRYSDVPFPLQYLQSFDDINSTKYFVSTQKKNSYLNDIAPILYLQSHCETSTERDLYVAELMKFAKVDSYGTCLNNKVLPDKFTHDYLNNLNENEFLKFVAKYKFVIAIENGVCTDYVSEKFWRAIKVGSVPIYFGCPRIKDWLPNENAAILLQDFPTPKILNEHINKLLKDDKLYETYLEHKTKNIVTNPRISEEFRKRQYQTDLLKTVEKFECFVCNKIHEKMKGKSEVSVVNKKHYNCPTPLSALQLGVNPMNSWVLSWEYNKEKAYEIYKSLINSN